MFTKLLDWISNLLDGGEVCKDKDLMSCVKRPIRIGIIILFMFFIVFSLWAALFKFESYVIANGQVNLMSGTDIIQHREGGVIKEILVSEGDHVFMGQPIIKLEDKELLLQLQKLNNNLCYFRAVEERLLAERNNIEMFHPSETLISSCSDIELELSSSIINTQLDIFNSRRSTVIQKNDIFNHKAKQSDLEIESLNLQIESLSAQIILIEEELSNKKTLLESGAYAKANLTTLEKQYINMMTSKKDNEINLEKTQERLREIFLEKTNFQEQFRVDILNELKTVQVSRKEMEIKIQETQDDLKKKVITSSNEGFINKIDYLTIGGVISPHSRVAELVPDLENLVINIAILPQDITSILEAQKQENLLVRVDGFEGIKSKIRINSSTRKQIDLIDSVFIYVSPSLIDSAYMGKIIIPKKQIARLLENNVDLYPGMPVQAYVTTGSRNFISYMLSPFLNSMEKAFTEK